MTCSVPLREASHGWNSGINEYKSFGQALCGHAESNCPTFPWQSWIGAAIGAATFSGLGYGQDPVSDAVRVRRAAALVNLGDQ